SRSGGNGVRRRKRVERFRRHLDSDQALFSLARGTNEAIKRARVRMSSVPGVTEVVMAMASFDPSDRPTMLKVMQSHAFSSLRIQPSRGGG
ncbi:unnamed protein product, partial [Choristocarpus tenellus]